MSAELQSEILDGSSAVDALRLRLAAQLAPRRWRGALASLAAAIDGGEPLQPAFERRQATIPAELRCLITESLHVPESSKLILDAVRIRQTIGRDWHELIQLMIYPFLLFILALVVGGGFSFLMLGPHTAWIVHLFDDFGLAGAEPFVAFMHDQHHSIVGLTLASGWTLIVLLTVALLGPRWAWSAVLGGVTLIGPPLRWISLRELLQRYELFLSQGLSPIAATDAVTRTFRHSGQAVAAAAIAHRVQSGMPLGQALCGSLLSDGLSRPALRLLDLRGSDMPRALEETAALLGSLTEQRCRGLALLLPMFSILFVGTIVWATFSVYLLAFLPLISLMTSLV